MRLTLAFCAALASSSALANFHDGNKILEYCRGSGALNEAFCYGLIAGLSDGLTTSHMSTICTPNSVTLQQVRDIIVQHVTINPATRHQASSVLAYIALSTAFPCRR